MIYKSAHVDLIYEVLADFAEIGTMESVKGVLVSPSHHTQYPYVSPGSSHGESLGEGMAKERDVL